MMRIVLTALGAVAFIPTVTSFRARADQSTLAVFEWAILAFCLLGPLWLVWQPSATERSNAERVWLTVLLYAGIGLAIRLR